MRGRICAVGRFFMRKDGDHIIYYMQVICEIPHIRQTSSDYWMKRNCILENVRQEIYAKIGVRVTVYRQLWIQSWNFKLRKNEIPREHSCNNFVGTHLYELEYQLSFAPDNAADNMATTLRSKASCNILQTKHTYIHYYYKFSGLNGKGCRPTSKYMHWRTALLCTYLAIGDL